MNTLHETRGGALAVRQGTGQTWNAWATVRPGDECICC